MKVELIYERTCPNISAARTRLIEAFQSTDLQPKWYEWEVSQPDTPEYARKFGSPTILVDGRDVSGDCCPSSGNSCRLYTTATGFEPIPPLRKIEAALGQDVSTKLPKELSIAALPSVGLALLPKLTCPVCWPAYTALLSSAGIGFIDYTPYLLPVMTVFLALTLAALAYRAKSRRGYGPFSLGIAGTIGILIGKFVAESDLALHFGIALLIGASLWNVWPRRANRFSKPVTSN